MSLDVTPWYVCELAGPPKLLGEGAHRLVMVRLVLGTEASQGELPHREVAS